MLFALEATPHRNRKVTGTSSVVNWPTSSQLMRGDTSGEGSAQRRGDEELHLHYDTLGPES